MNSLLRIACYELGYMLRITFYTNYLLSITGTDYYRYDDHLEKVSAGFPRKISVDFASKSFNSSESIPSHLDSVFFDHRDQMLYFFKDDEVFTTTPITISLYGKKHIYINRPIYRPK